MFLFIFLEKPKLEITKSFVVNQIKSIIPEKLLKILTNATIIVGTFPKSFNISEVLPVYKKDEPCDRNNY